jgi:predicted dehydrogenase
MMDNSGLDRRQFLKTAATVAVGAHVAASSVRAQDDQKLRMGLIGCGGQGTVLLTNALRVPEIEWVATCDIVEEKAQGAAERIQEGGTVPTFTNYQDMLESVEMDAVAIAVPLHWHAPIAIAAFETGLHVFCEKCMAYTVDECKDMIRAQMSANKILQIGHHLRYHPLYWHAKRTFVEGGLLGQITSIYAQWNRNNSWRRPVAIEGDFTEWGYPDADHLVNWRLYQEYSGGLMTELASHQIDVVTWMLDRTPTAVQGMGGVDFYDDGRTVPDNVHVSFEYPGGVTFDYISGTTNAFSIFGNQCHEVIKGTEGTLVMTHLNPGPTDSMGWFFPEEGTQREIWMDMAHKADIGGHEAILLDATVTEGPPLAGQPISTLIDGEGHLQKMTYQVEFEEFVISCREMKLPSCDGMIGMKSAADAIMANQAIATGETLPFPEDMYEITM